MRQKINKDIQDLNSDLEQVNSINIYRALHFKYIKYAFSTLNTQNIDQPLLIPIFRIKQHSRSFSLFFFLFLPLLKKKKKFQCALLRDLTHSNLRAGDSQYLIFSLDHFFMIYIHIFISVWDITMNSPVSTYPKWNLSYFFP